MKWKWLIPFLVVFGLSLFFHVYGEKEDGTLWESIFKNQEKRAVENIHVYFEKLSEVESVFYNTMDSITELEDLEGLLLEQMFLLKETEKEEIEYKKNQIISFAESRLEKVEKSTKDMMRVYREKNKLATYKNKIKKENWKQSLEELYQATKRREEEIQKLLTMYEEATKKDIELYEAVADYDRESEEIEELLLEVKTFYDAISKQQENVEEATEEFLEKKKEFYVVTGLEQKK